MATQRYSGTPHPIDTLLTWVKSGEIAIPEIQRPFVWPAVKVRNLLDSLYHGYPVGYLISWRNPTIKLNSPWQKSSRHSTVPASRRTALRFRHILPVCTRIAPCPAGAGTVSVLAGLLPRADMTPIDPECFAGDWSLIGLQ
jgi:hypothetical protein